jgi:predicted permease
MIGLYRALLRLYPIGFRHEYGDEMAQIFAQRAAGASIAGRLALLLAAVLDIMVNAAAAHVELLRQDLAYAARTLRRTPLFTLTAVLVIALGVGANTAAFSVANFVLVQPLPFPESESVVRLCEGPRTGPTGWGCNNQLSPLNYRDFREQTSSFAQLGAFNRDAVNLVGGSQPERLPLARLTAAAFAALGVQPLLGAVFDSAETGADDRRVVLSYGLWQSHFGRDPSVLGRTVNLDGAAYVVIGIMPRTFYFPTRDVQLWTPLRLASEDYSDRGNSFIEAVGRLRDGVTFEDARADLDVVVDRLAQTYPENAETGVSFFRMRDEYSPRFKLMLQALCGASLCILLIACTNLANLLLVRAGARERELAVRAALGAGRERLARQLITESITLALIGGAAGVLVAVIGIRVLSVLIPTTLPIGTAPGLDLRLLGIAGLFTLLTGLGFGLVPALRAGRRAGFDALRSSVRASGTRQQRYRSLLVAIEVAASVVLLIGAGLLLRAVLRVQAVEPGFRADGVLSIRTVLPRLKYSTVERRTEFYQRVLQQVRALPGVSSASYTSGLPMVLTGGIARVVLPGEEVRPDGNYSVSRRYITPQYFAALGIPLLSGRDLEETDTGERAAVAVVSESFARRYWPDEAAVGNRFLYQDSTYTVVGVVGDVRVRGLERTSEPQMYLPASRMPTGPLTAYDPKDLVIRSSAPPLTLLPAVRRIVRSVDPDQPISDVITLSELLAHQTETRRAQVNVLGALAVVAMLLTGLGINGLLAYTVAQRRREIGVRLALGAEPRRIARGVVWDGVRLVLIGIVPGLLVAYWAARFINALLFGIPPADATTIAATIGLCLGTALLGALIPAMRAVRVSPLTVMQAE